MKVNHTTLKVNMSLIKKNTRKHADSTHAPPNTVLYYPPPNSGVLWLAWGRGMAINQIRVARGPLACFVLACRIDRIGTRRAECH